MRISFTPGEDPREALVVLSEAKIATATRAMELVNAAPDLKVIKMEISVGDSAVEVEAFVSREGRFHDDTWNNISLDGGELGRPSIGVSASDGQSRKYKTELDGVKVAVTLRRRF